MFVASSHHIMMATMLGDWELVVIAAVLLMLVGVKKLPDIVRGIGNGMSQFRKGLDGLAHEAGRSVGGIFGKPAAEALTPANQTAELYDPAVFRRGGRKRRLFQQLRNLWRRIIGWFSLNN